MREISRLLSRLAPTKVGHENHWQPAARPSASDQHSLVGKKMLLKASITSIQEMMKRLSLSRRFLLVSSPILLVGTLVIGQWVAQEVEISVVRKIGGVSALYVDSFVAPHVQSLARSNILTDSDQAALRSDLANTPLAKKVISLKIWRSDGVVLFSTDESDQGKQFPIDEGLAVALTGNIFSEVSVRTLEQQAQHGQPMPRLIETYTPIHKDRNGGILAVAEFYQVPDEVDREVRTAQQLSWLVVAGTTLAMYLLLFIVVRRGSMTITTQQRELRDKISQLTVLNDKNLNLQARVIRAAERSTALNETFLQRVSADIHDGPGQDLGFALMQLKNIDNACQSNATLAPLNWPKEIMPIKLSLESALSELRAISSDLVLPDIEFLNPSAIARRVVRDFQSKTGADVTFDDRLPEVIATFRIKVTLYRVLQESLANTFRHAAAKDCRITLSGNSEYLFLEVSDKGPGFDVDAASKKGRHGLRGMRQRVEVVGGTFDITSAAGAGTQIKVSLPLTSRGALDD